ncbi:MAG: Lrp/AsnC family transcriptional regulator [Deltaproteobacteria bacterium HGW-Deltaproteobacteria-12]|jgi:DNA-binding Lrp family transcriptional regulator|nr:MAG: Lrp/AsnC family transcriptional regulator [Deltaproteobacteria bacterium HGW-Deltaproteobacteria-12]
MEKLTVAEKKVARLIQRDIPLMKSPFQEIGIACGLSEQEVLNIIRRLQQRGHIRRFAAILRHQQAGYTRNALIVWSVPHNKIEDAGKILAAFPFISHCYARKPAFQNKYNLFSMLHTQNENIEFLSHQMAESINSHDFLILESIQEYKKISPEYFE